MRVRFFMLENPMAAAVPKTVAITAASAERISVFCNASKMRAF